MSTSPEVFATFLVEIAEYYRTTFNHRQFLLYWRDLHRFPLDKLRQGWQNYRLTPPKGCYIPKPIDLISHLSAQENDSARKIWQGIIQQVRQLGPYHPFKYPNTRVRDIITEMGGPLTLCQLSESAMLRQQALFTEHYQSERPEKSVQTT